MMNMSKKRTTFLKSCGCFGTRTGSCGKYFLASPCG